MRINCINGFDFSDSEFNSFTMTDDYELTLYMKNWQEIPMRVIFKNVIQFNFSLGDIPENLYVITESTPFFQNALKQEYGIIPAEHPFKLYYLNDIDDYPFIQVVAESVVVLK